jgi:ribosomal protein S18 acetylase RimI-like enzyme
MNLYEIKKNISKNSYSLILYLNDKELKKKNINDSYSFIEVIVCKKDLDCNIIYLETNKKYKNRGYASYLIQCIIKKMRKNKIKKIFLDDMSLNAREKNNIYIKNGFKYINEYPEPEMILEL